jgi:hypothetical protein
MTEDESGPVMARRTYYFSAEVADALAAAVARLHHGSHGRLSKGAALDAIITAGIERIEDIERGLREPAGDAPA